MIVEKVVNIFKKGDLKTRFKNIGTEFDVQKGKISAVISESEYEELKSGEQTLFQKTAKAEMTADKINWIVQGESKTEFTLTDRTAELLTKKLTITNQNGSQTIISGGKMDIEQIFSEDVTATGTIRGATLIGGSIDIGDGNCVVDKTGKITAKDLVVEGGTINIADKFKVTPEGKTQLLDTEIIGKVTATEIVAEKSYAIRNGNSESTIIYYEDNGLIRLGVLKNKSELDGAGFEFFKGEMYAFGNATFEKTITAQDFTINGSSLGNLGRFETAETTTRQEIPANSWTKLNLKFSGKLSAYYLILANARFTTAGTFTVRFANNTNIRASVSQDGKLYVDAFVAQVVNSADEIQLEVYASVATECSYCGIRGIVVGV